jgi:Arc/MetJ-type ribon-helix-helix transcriptional regulator
MSNNLSSENERYIEHAVLAGIYRDRDEVLDKAVELLRRREQLLRDVNRGIEQLERGEGRPFDLGKIKTIVRDRMATS